MLSKGLYLIRVLGLTLRICGLPRVSVMMCKAAVLKPFFSRKPTSSMLMSNGKGGERNTRGAFTRAMFVLILFRFYT